VKASASPVELGCRVITPGATGGTTTRVSVGVSMTACAKAGGAKAVNTATAKTRRVALIS